MEKASDGTEVLLRLEALLRLVGLREGAFKVF